MDKKTGRKGGWCRFRRCPPSKKTHCDLQCSLPPFPPEAGVARDERMCDE